MLPMIEDEKTTQHSRWFSEILKPLLDDLREFPYAMIKGPVLAVQVYGDEEARNYHDIDFLIPKELNFDRKSVSGIPSQQRK